MNPNLGVDRVLRDYFADDGLLAPDHVLDVIEERILRQPQRRAWRVPWRDSNPNTNLKPQLAIAAIIVVAVAGFALLRPSGPAVVGPPVSTESPQACRLRQSCPRLRHPPRRRPAASRVPAI